MATKAKADSNLYVKKSATTCSEMPQDTIQTWYSSYAENGHSLIIQIPT